MPCPDSPFSALPPPEYSSFSCWGETCRVTLHAYHCSFRPLLKRDWYVYFGTYLWNINIHLCGPSQFSLHKPRALNPSCAAFVSLHWTLSSCSLLFLYGGAQNWAQTNTWPQQGRADGEESPPLTPQTGKAGCSQAQPGRERSNYSCLSRETPAPKAASPLTPRPPRSQGLREGTAPPATAPQPRQGQGKAREGTEQHGTARALPGHGGPRYLV